MKKSKMLKDISELIEANIETLTVIPDASLLAALILEYQEKAGMLPPYKSKDRQYPDSLKQHTWTDENDKD